MASIRELKEAVAAKDFAQKHKEVASAALKGYKHYSHSGQPKDNGYNNKDVEKSSNVKDVHNTLLKHGYAYGGKSTMFGRYNYGYSKPAGPSMDHKVTVSTHKDRHDKVFNVHFDTATDRS